MGLFDSVTADDMRWLTDPDMMPGAEAIGFTPLAGAARTINAQVFRQLPEDVAEAQGNAAGMIEVSIQRHATLGALAIDIGGDKFSLPKHLGGDTVTHRIVAIVKQDAQRFHLRLRG